MFNKAKTGRRKLSRYEKEIRRWLLRQISEFYLPDDEFKRRNPCLTKEEFAKVLLEDFEGILKSELVNDEA
jgi:hypothetical protein